MTDTTSLDPNLSFEDTLVALQTIVEELEKGNLPLADTISRFEKGTRLAERCQKLVSEAELRITVLSDVEEDLDDDDDSDAMSEVPF